MDNLALLRALLAQAAPDRRFPLVISDRARLSLATLAAYEAAGVRSLGPLPDSALTTALLEQAAATDWAAHPLASRPARDQRADPGAGAEAPAGVYSGGRLTVDLPLPAVGATPARAVRRPARVVRSTRKAARDAGHRETLLTRLEAGLADLAGKLNRGRSRRRAAVARRLATLLHAPGTARVRRWLQVLLDGDDDHLTLQVQRDRVALAQAAARDGLYVLVTNEGDVDDEAMRAQTKGRDQIEKRLGIFTGPLAVRPMFLEKAGRIRALLFICLLALLVYSLLEHRARQAGLPLTGRKVLERFAVCNAVLTTCADGTALLLAAPLSAWQQEVAHALALPDFDHWLVPLDPLPS